MALKHAGRIVGKPETEPDEECYVDITEVTDNDRFHP